jgi:hypothetical protein
MKVIDPGHKYELDHLDGNKKSKLTFVKREGDKYPGNIGHYEGTNIQEVIRVLIDRVKYLDNQDVDTLNSDVLYYLRMCIWCLEVRAARRHKRSLNTKGVFDKIESLLVCNKCGHIGCKGECHA